MVLVTNKQEIVEFIFDNVIRDIKEIGKKNPFKNENFEQIRIVRELKEEILSYLDKQS